MKKGVYLTHVLPLRPHEWALFDIGIAVQAKLSPGRLKPRSFKGLILKIRGLILI